jgi:hypothetical protein
MTAAFCLCMPYGIGTYRFEVLDAKSRDLGAVPPMTKLRNNHRAWNMSAALCAFAGLVVIVTNKIRQNHSPLALSAHGWMGVLALLGIIVQAVVGILKMKELTATGNKTMSWHGSPPPEPSQLHAVSRAERCVCLPYLQPLTRQPAAQGCWELQPSGALWWRCRHSASYSQPRFQTCPCPRAACRLPSGLHAARSNPRHDSCCCLAPPRAFPQPVVPTQAVWVVIVIVRFTGMFRPPPNAPWRVLHDSRTPRSRGSRVPWPQRRRRRRLCSGPVDGAGTLAGKGVTGACCPVWCYRPSM